MNKFNTLYREIMTEMARPAVLAPSLLGREAFSRYNDLILKISDRFKYGVAKYPELIDSRGEPAYGLGDNILQDRKLRYFYFCITKHYTNVDYDNRISINHEDLRAIMDMKLYLKKIGLPYPMTTLQKSTYANVQKILENPKWFNSDKFQKVLLDPTLMATFMNASREKFHHTSINAARDRENIAGASIKDIHKARAETRDDERRKNWDIRNAAHKQRYADERENKKKLIDRKLNKLSDRNKIRKNKIPRK